MTSKAPAVDLDHKFRCKVVDCLKFFRKAKLLHYHMKYFHGMEKSPEPEENSGKRHVQTRGSSASDKASQESLTRKRVSASSPSKHFGSGLYLYHEGWHRKRALGCSGPVESLKIENDKWSSGIALWSCSLPGGSRNTWLSFLPPPLAAQVTLRKSLSLWRSWYSWYGVGTVKERELC